MPISSAAIAILKKATSVCFAFNLDGHTIRACREVLPTRANPTPGEVETVIPTLGRFFRFTHTAPVHTPPPSRTRSSASIRRASMTHG